MRQTDLRGRRDGLVALHHAIQVVIAEAKNRAARILSTDSASGSAGAMRGTDVTSSSNGSGGGSGSGSGGGVDLVQLLLQSGADPDTVVVPPVYKDGVLVTVGLNPSSSSSSSNRINSESTRHSSCSVLLDTPLVMIVNAAIELLRIARIPIANASSSASASASTSGAGADSRAARANVKSVAGYVDGSGEDGDEESESEADRTMKAAQMVLLDVASLLLEYGANITSRGRKGMSALHLVLW